jgi:hypothetical protein
MLRKIGASIGRDVNDSSRRPKVLNLVRSNSRNYTSRMQRDHIPTTIDIADEWDMSEVDPLSLTGQRWLQRADNYRPNRHIARVGKLRQPGVAHLKEGSPG